MGLTQKYFGEQDPDLHGGVLTWPGNDAGFPLVGNAQFHGDLKQQEFEDLGVSFTFRCRTFRTWDDKDMEQYQRVQDYIANGWFHERRNDRVYDEGTQGWRIFLEWVQVYSENPKAAPMTGRA